MSRLRKDLAALDRAQRACTPGRPVTFRRRCDCGRTWTVTLGAKPTPTDRLCACGRRRAWAGWTITNPVTARGSGPGRERAAISFRDYYAAIRWHSPTASLTSVAWSVIAPFGRPGMTVQAIVADAQDAVRRPEPMYHSTPEGHILNRRAVGRAARIVHANIPPAWLWDDVEDRLAHMEDD